MRTALASLDIDSSCFNISTQLAQGRDSSHHMLKKLIHDLYWHLTDLYKLPPLDVKPIEEWKPDDDDDDGGMFRSVY